MQDKINSKKRDPILPAPDTREKIIGKMVISVVLKAKIPKIARVTELRRVGS